MAKVAIRVWADRDAARDRALESWGTAGFEEFQRIAWLRTMGVWRSELDRLAAEAERALPAMDRLLRELRPNPRHRGNGKMTLALPPNSLPSLGVMGFLQETVKGAKEALRGARVQVAAVRGGAEEWISRKWGDGSEMFPSMAFELNGFVRAVRRAVRTAPPDPCEWGYAAIAAHIAKPCATLRDWKALEKNYGRALRQVAHKTVQPLA